MAEVGDVNTESLNHTFTDKKLGAFTAIIEGDVVNTKPESGWISDYTVDKDKAVAILTPHMPQDEVLKPEQLEQGETEVAFRNVVKAFVDHKVIDPQTAELTGKLVRPSNITLIDATYFRFLYMADEFPKSASERGELEMGHLGYGRMTRNLVRKLESAGVELRSEQMRGVVLRWIISHEYGHAVDAALQIQKAEEVGKSKPDEEKWKVKADVDRHASQELFTTIAPEPKLQEMFTIQDARYAGLHDDALQTSSERISTGFEYLGLRYALTDAGVAEDKIDKVLDAFKEEDQKSFQDLEHLFKVGKEKGMDIETLGVALNTLKLELRKTEKPELKKTLPLSFGSTYAGYFFPLSETQLKAYIASFKV